MCNESGKGGASATHTSTYYPIFAQKFAQFKFVCNTVCNKDGNNTQTYLKVGNPQTMRNTVCNTQLQPKTTTNNILNPKDASNIRSPHHHYHIGFPHN